MSYKKEENRMKTTLCLDCLYGLVREYDCEDDNCKERHFNNKCLLGDDYVGVITMCNKCKKKETKVTYHDPDFDEYANKVQTEAVKDAMKNGSEHAQVDLGEFAEKDAKEDIHFSISEEEKEPMEYDGEAGCWVKVNNSATCRERKVHKKKEIK